MHNKILPTQAKAMAAEILEEVNIFLQQKKYYQALEKIQQLFELNQFDNDLIFQRAELHYLLGEYDNAYHWLKIFADNQGLDPRSYILNSEIQLKIGHKEESAKILHSCFQALHHGYIALDSENIKLRLDELIKKLKKSYKWNKLIRLCPEIKNYESQRRKELKKGTPNIKTNELPQEDTAVKEEDLPVVSENDLPMVEETTEIVATTSKELITAPAKDMTTIPSKEVSTTPSKELAINPNKDVATTPNKEMDTIPEKSMVTPMEKLIAEQREKIPEVEDDYRRLSYEEIFNLIKELWDKGRLGVKQQRLLVRQDTKVIQKAIEDQILSLRKQIWLFNYVANIFRQRLLFEEAILLLRAALLYDDEDPIILKNLGYTLLSNGETDVAKEILEDAQLGDLKHKNIDYAVLDLLIQC